MNGRYKALWLDKEGNLVVLDQRALPFEKKSLTIKSAKECEDAIKNMTVRGAGVIGNCGAFGVYLAAREFKDDMTKFYQSAQSIQNARPTAVNLEWAVKRMLKKAKSANKNDLVSTLKEEALLICDEDAKNTQNIAKFAADLFEEIMKKKGKNDINILTHCNAGWLAIVDEGTALAPIYELKRRGVEVHVFVDETRPRNQGANLTAWELSQSDINYTIIPDNTGGYLMQQKMVDVCITGADRVSINGDVANKIGTYLKALAAKDNDIPFFVALASSTFDFDIVDAIKDMPIEIRDEDEIKSVKGLNENGDIVKVQIMPDNFSALNYGFDITPSRLITALITERGVCKADIKEIKNLYGDLL